MCYQYMGRYCEKVLFTHRVCNTLPPLLFNIIASLYFLPSLPTLEKTYLVSRPPAGYGVSYLLIQFNYYTIISSVHTSV